MHSLNTNIDHNNTNQVSNRTKFNDTLESHSTISPLKSKRHRFIKLPE